MSIYRRLLYYLKFFFKGKKEIFSFLDNEATIYYERCDDFHTKLKAVVYSLMVTNVSCEIYEQMIYGFKHMFQGELFDVDAIKNMYRINLVYFYVRFNYEYPNEWGILEERDFSTFTKLKSSEKKLIHRYAQLIENSKDIFELEFLKSYSKIVFKEKTLSPYTVALAGNILYNSYQGFVEDYFMYIRRYNIA